MLSWSYLGKRQYELALQQTKEALRIPEAGPYVEADLGAIYAVMGERAKARNILRTLESESKRRLREQPYVGIARSTLR